MVRPPRSRQLTRGTWLSVGAHTALGVLLLVGVTIERRPLNETAPFITAEIVPLALPATPAPSSGANVPAAAPVAPAAEPPAAPPEPPRREPAPRSLPPPVPVDTEAAAPAAASEPQSLADDDSLAPSAEPVAEEATAPDVATATPLPRAAPSQPLDPYELGTLRRRLASWTGRFSADAVERTISWRDDGHAYTAVLRPLPAADAMGMEQLAVHVTTQRGGEQLVTELRMTRLAFSNFGQFVNRWDPGVMLHDDIIDGRFHSNTAFTVGRIDASIPVFGDKVTIAGGDGVTIADGSGFATQRIAHVNRRKMFPAGLEIRVPRIALPERAFASAATPNSERFERDTALRFYADGSVGWRDLDASPRNETRRAIGQEPLYLIGAEDVAFHVQGTVDGKVLVYSPTRIVITDDLNYVANPREPHADDYLGLVSEGTVEIAEPDVTGAGDLDVYASIYAGRRFAVREYRSRPSGVLHIHGSLTAGTLSASEPRYGTHIEFDQRLTTMRAPGFPLSDRYELDSVAGEWRVVAKP